MDERTNMIRFLRKYQVLNMEIGAERDRGITDKWFYFFSQREKEFKPIYTSPAIYCSRDEARIAGRDSLMEESARRLELFKTLLKSFSVKRLD